MKSVSRCIAQQSDCKCSEDAVSERVRMYDLHLRAGCHHLVSFSPVILGSGKDSPSRRGYTELPWLGSGVPTVFAMYLSGAGPMPQYISWPCGRIFELLLSC